jgi:SAM-dependent methyltransferase
VTTCASDDWTRVAPAWDRLGEDIESLSESLTRALLDGAAIAPGERVLELGAGTGRLAVRLAELVGRTGCVHASDVAAGMVELINRRTDGLPQVTVGEVDAVAIPAADGEYDVVVFRMGLMLVPEPDAALREIRRVLRPGGRLAAAVWGDPGHNPWLASVGIAAMSAGLLEAPPPVASGGPMSLGDPETLEGRVRAAGFADVRVAVHDFSRHYEAEAHHIEMVRALAPPIAAAIDRATAEQLETMTAAATRLTAPYRTEDGGLDLPARALVLTAS